VPVPTRRHATHVQGIAADIHLKTAFAETPHALVGREDFFAAFRVSFDERGQRFTLERYDAP